MMRHHPVVELEHSLCSSSSSSNSGVVDLVNVRRHFERSGAADGTSGSTGIDGGATRAEKRVASEVVASAVFSDGGAGGGDGGGRGGRRGRGGKAALLYGSSDVDSVVPMSMGGEGDGFDDVGVGRSARRRMTSSLGSPIGRPAGIVTSPSSRNRRSCGIMTSPSSRIGRGLSEGARGGPRGVDRRRHRNWPAPGEYVHGFPCRCLFSSLAIR